MPAIPFGTPPASLAGVGALSLTATALAGPPTIALFASSARARDAARARLPMHATVVSAGTLALARAAANAVDCVVVARARADECGLGALVLGVAEGLGAPLIVCADATPVERVELARAGVAALVAPGAPAALLWGEVQCAVSAALLARTAARLGEVRLGPALRDALAVLCATDPPPASVEAVSATVGAHRRTLWYQWRQRARGPVPRFEDVVTTVLLVRAFMRRARGAKWSAVAEQCGVHRHSLARGAHRMLGLATLPPRSGERADVAHAAVRRAFVENVVRPVLRRQSP
ncbi:MAG: hypothetical protein ACJ79S_00135 [Gemmatimonadaceae bacterium]